MAAVIVVAGLLGTVPMQRFAAEGAAQEAAARNTLPTVAILATGGTIASRGSGSLALTDYGSGAGHKPVGVEALVDAVPEIRKFADITGEQVFNVGSSKLSIANSLTLVCRVNEVFAGDNVDCVVITHGTDTLEETAYFLNLVVKSDKPVVLVGAMRPSTGPSAAGPLNHVNAVALAASREARGKGVMVVMNAQISSAFGVTKTNTTNVATFKCLLTGCLGIMQNNLPHFTGSTAKRHTVSSEFDVSGLKDLYRVDIHYSCLGRDEKIVDAMAAVGAKGIVSAGVGHGNASNEVMASLVAAGKAGVKVVVASRVPTGMVTPVGRYTREGFISAMGHNPQKARILLMLALTNVNFGASFTSNANVSETN